MAVKPVLGGMVICRPAVLEVPFGGSHGFTLMSDLHIGAPQVDYALIKEELKQARVLGDRVLINGDVFDCISWQDRKRFRPSAIHPRLRGRDDYITAAVDWAVELLGPYADLIDMVGTGNHDDAASRWHNIDPINVLVHELTRLLPKKVRTKHIIHYGGYCGFVDYRFRERPEGSHGGKRWVIYYHHGSGGAAPITKGILDMSRRDIYIEADVIWLGHKHNRFNVSVQRLACPRFGYDIVTRDVRHVMSGSYLRTYVGQTQESMRRHGRRSNYAADMGMAPQGMGGARVEVEHVSDGPLAVKVIQ